MSQKETYEIELPQFKGPFDLLLFFIKRDELDIYDIPIYQITEDFLDYIQKMKEINMEVASEFILVAATLMRIKARMLLPRVQVDEDGNEIDPREELVQKILEYKQFKELSQIMQEMEEVQYKKVKRHSASKELKSIADKYQTELEMESLDLSKLVTVFNKLLIEQKRRDNDTVHEIKTVEFTIAEEREFVLKNLEKKDKCAFEELFDSIENHIQAIVRFLAILELTQENLIKITLGDGVNNFWVTINIDVNEQ